MCSVSLETDKFIIFRKETCKKITNYNLVLIKRDRSKLKKVDFQKRILF